VGRHEAISRKIAQMAAETYAMESVASLAAQMSDRGGYDIRLEAAAAKEWATARTWEIVDDTMQVRGGRGYETAASLALRGEKPYPVERAMRDFRINLIFEGSSEIMRLFIAREAVDHHFKLAFDVVRPDATMQERMRALRRSIPFYLTWYPTRWVNARMLRGYGEFGRLARHVRFAERATRRLGRAVFHSMLRYGPKLERRQMVLFRAVDVGAELFAMSAACSRAIWLARKGETGAIELADLFCREARDRIIASFRDINNPNDNMRYRVALNVLAGDHTWLEQGIAWHVVAGEALEEAAT
jgi:alkylation response protein AidB-like acyl-CoA dehydrogenase